MAFGKQILIPALSAVLLLAACQPEPEENVVPEPEPGAEICGAAELQYLVGKPDSVLYSMRFAKGVRIITPGMAVTMDYNPERLNIAIGEDGRIARVYCG
ncbi:MAG: hypothetical protein GY947_11290 [Rhodobacteraceae bacterium]|nr:hypothetical protein [Paracoccaceae bacterium]